MKPPPPYNDRRPIPPELYSAQRCAEPPPHDVLRGIEQFNARDYFACHETLEIAWNAEPQPIRTLYKGLLQVGVGCYHLLSGNYRGAILKLQTGADYLQPFAPQCMNIAIDLFIHDARRLREALIAHGPEHIGEFDHGLLPIIHLIAHADETPTV